MRSLWHLYTYYYYNILLCFGPHVGRHFEFYLLLLRRPAASTAGRTHTNTNYLSLNLIEYLSFFIYIFVSFLFYNKQYTVILKFVKIFIFIIINKKTKIRESKIISGTQAQSLHPIHTFFFIILFVYCILYYVFLTLYLKTKKCNDVQRLYYANVL